MTNDAEQAEAHPTDPDVQAAKNRYSETEDPGQLQTIEPGPIQQATPAQPANLSPTQLIVEAKRLGMTAPEIKEMMDLQDRHDRKMAKQAFDYALAQFKRNPPQVFKDAYNDQTQSWYSSIGNMVNTVNEAMAPFDLNARWEYPDPTKERHVRVTCILAHAAGHQEEVTIEGPYDDKGPQGTINKTDIHAAKSARTYLRLETFEAVTGMASRVMLDDDGNGAQRMPSNKKPPPQAEPKAKRISEHDALTVHASIVENDLDMDLFMNWLKSSHKIDAIEDITQGTVHQSVKKKIEVTIKTKLAQDSYSDDMPPPEE